MKAVIIDDEKDSRELIKNYLLEEAPFIRVVGEADSVKTGIQLLSELEIDVLFLDIQLKQNSSFEILNNIDQYEFNIIFITAHDEYAIEAIKHHAFDYLLKPLERKELKNAIERLSKKSKKEYSNDLTSLLKNIDASSSPTKQIKLPTLTGFKIVNTDDIIYLESDGNYTHIYMTNNINFLVSKTLKEYENLLSNNEFCRIHHSYIINTKFMKEYIKGRGGQVILQNNKVLNVSQNKKQNLLKIWK